MAVGRPAAQFMEDDTVHPQPFFFQVLFDGGSGGILSAVDETDVLLPVVHGQFPLVLGLLLCHQVKG